MNHRRFFPLGIVIVIAVIALFLFLFLARKSDSARSNFYRLQKELNSYRRGIWHLEKLDPKQLQEELMKQDARFPSSEQLGLLLGELTELAKNDGISIASISPSEKVETRETEHDILSGLNRIPMEMRIIGRYEHIEKFLMHLSQLKHGIMKIERFHMEKEKMDESLSPLIVSLTASVYVKKTADQKILEEKLTEVPIERQAEKSRFVSIERDPFTKAVVQVSASKAISLEGIIYDASQPIALVNGEAKGIGDTVNGMKILEIHSDSVVFEKNGEKVKMQLRWS